MRNTKAIKSDDLNISNSLVTNIAKNKLKINIKEEKYRYSLSFLCSLINKSNNVKNINIIKAHYSHN